MVLNGEAVQRPDPIVPPPDIDSASTAAWPRRTFPIQGSGRRNVVQVIIKRSVLNAIREHGLSRTDVEVCGVLVGEGYQDERGPFIYVEAMVQGKHSDNKVAQVTFTSETWTHIQDEMERNWGGLRILGWYHTHPNFGIFLSGMDMFIHENFFNHSEQLALVYDPVRGEDGLFVWHDGKADGYHYLVDEDADVAGPASSYKPALTAAAASLDGDDTPARLQRLERRHSVLEWFVIATIAFAVVWPVFFGWYWGGFGASARPPRGGRLNEQWETDAPVRQLPSGHRRGEASGVEPREVKPQGAEPEVPKTEGAKDASDQGTDSTAPKPVPSGASAKDNEDAGVRAAPRRDPDGIRKQPDDGVRSPQS